MFEALRELDRTVFFKINGLHSPILDVIMWHLSLSWHTYFFVLLVGFIFYRKFKLRKAIEFVVGCAIVAACTDLSTNLVKHNVKRFRPTHHVELREKVVIVNDYRGGQFSFFSSHAANSVGITTFIFLCLRWVRKKYRFLLFLYPALICYSRMYLGVHYPADILGGIIDGLIFGSLGFLVMDTYFLKLNEYDV